MCGMLCEGGFEILRDLCGVVPLLPDFEKFGSQSRKMETPAGVIEEAKESKAKDEPVQCTSLASMILDAPPSCIEFSTLGDCIFVVGTYSLKETEDAGGAQSRNGSLVLMQWHDEKL